MDRRELRRRRSPQWIRTTGQGALHGIALRLMDADRTRGMTEGQEWLWSAVISELEFRFRHPSREWGRCACYLCCAPFPDPESSTDADDVAAWPSGSEPPGW